MKIPGLALWYNPLMNDVTFISLQESFEGQMNEDNIEIGISNENGFRRLQPAEVKDYLASIA